MADRPSLKGAAALVLPLDDEPWWLVGMSAWVGPGRWLADCALPMRGRVAAGGDPVPPAQIPVGARVLEGPLQILPGLHDFHIHAGLIDLPALHRGGIAAATDLGGVPEQLAQLRRQSLDQASELPVLDIAGAFLTAPGGYPSDRSWAAPGSWREVRSAADAVTAVAEQAAFGAALIKVAINADAGPVLAPSVLTALVAAAHAIGLPVVAHAQGQGTVAAALNAGVDLLAHTPWTQPLEPGLLRAAARQTTWISTLSIHDRDAAAVATDNLFGFLEHGGQVRYGTDLGNGRRRVGVSSDEILALQQTGLSVDEVLVSMTGPLTGPAGPSRFTAGVAPCLLVNPVDPYLRVVGPYLREALVCSDKEMQRMYSW